jgi:hypothetical protein
MPQSRESRIESAENAAAQAVFKLVQEAQRVQPGKRRKLFLDVEGHRNIQGGFDADMLELQKEFLMGFLIQFLSEIHGPLISVKNPHAQNNDIPSELEIRDEGSKE